MASNKSRNSPDKGKVDEFEQRLEADELRLTLIEEQFAFHNRHSHAVLIILSGMLSSDVEDMLDHLNTWMDPRNIRVHALDHRHDALDAMENCLYPPQWRYWRRLPARGRIALFLDGWYRFALDPDMPRDTGIDEKLERRARLEEFFVREGITILKVWLHRSTRELAHRIEKLDARNRTRWQVTARDRAVAALSTAYRDRLRKLIRIGKSKGVPWQVIRAAGKDSRETVSRMILQALSAPAKPARPTRQARLPAASNHVSRAVPSLRPGEKYGEALASAQARLRELTQSPSFMARSLVIVFEGYDASGKGGTIRRLVRGIDPRQSNVVPIAAPTAEEQLYPYLWRFWRQMPPVGNVTILDRSWYGRVLVERVEGFAAPADWRRAYAEINAFEAELARHGVIVVKIFLDVSAEEQLRRFRARETTPHKRFKLTDDDWRNFEKRHRYEEAVAEMLARTATKVAPWTVIPSDDKPCARVETIRTVIRRLEETREPHSGT